jgi:F-type H+-transporting ATPase subunit delta
MITAMAVNSATIGMMMAHRRTAILEAFLRHFGPLSWLHPLPLYVTACPGFQGTVQQEFRPVDVGAPIPEFLGSGDEAAQRKRPFGRKGVYVAGSEVDTVSGVAGRYATALFELAKEEAQLDKIATDLNRFNEALDAFEDMKRLVKSPVFSAEEQGRALAAILDKIEIEGLAKNFLLLVTKNRRLFATPDMIRAFRAMLARERGEASATVTSATKLTETQITALKQALKAALHKEVMLDVQIDPSLLGGLIVKVGSRMVDTSLRTRLNSLKIAMKEVG